MHKQYLTMLGYSGRDYTVAQRNKPDALECLGRYVAAAIQDGCSIEYINLLAAASSTAPLGDVRPTSSAPVSMGARIAHPNGFVVYYWLVPVETYADA